MSRQLIEILLLLWLIQYGSAVSADDEKNFKIELLIFAQYIPTEEIFEHYQSQIEWPRRLAELGEFQSVSSQYHSLQGIEVRLKRSRSYRPLYHVAWTQAMQSNQLSTAVRLHDPSNHIDGFFRVHRGYYLYMIADLEYSPSNSPIFRINEKRRCKLNEIHYLDHPKFGIIARISPLQ